MKKLLMRLPYLQIIFSIVVAITILIGVGSVIKGDKGNPLYFQTEKNTRVGGPFEASNSSARYALTQSIVDNKSVILNKQLAEFASPDVVYYKGKFISIFTPGISFLGIPFYVLGSVIGFPQLLTYFMTSLFVILDIFLIAQLARKLTISYSVGIIAGCIFVFATNALSYGQTYTQHLASTAVVLGGLLCALSSANWKSNSIFGVLVGLGMLIDIPNAFFLFPIGLYMLAKNIHVLKDEKKTQLTINTSLLGILLGMLPLLLVFGWYNYQVTGSATKLAQTIGRTDVFAKTAPPQLQAKEPSTAAPLSFNLGFHLTFQTRPQLEGLYTLLISNERAWIFYSPIVFLGLLGFLYLYKNSQTRQPAVLILSIILLNILLYSMFDDPWGGWAFGPRYLIPAAGLLSLLIAPAIARLKKNIIFIGIFALLLYYSLWVNYLGALTTSAIPPKVEAIHLSKPIPYTYAYNQELIEQHRTSSLIYNVFLYRYITPQEYWMILVNSMFGAFILLYLYVVLQKNPRKEQI